ncbi:hypothetical protein [Streptomyces sp. NBC_01171]|uniref:hypothetical protein n=1 Tax=Streptomyces sp. NBC_01171 TaxID=2903757 RepID=UPI00386CE51F|nr:hypothetical protein OG448_10670 [Streptomyces sp. NBC_01171]
MSRETDTPSSGPNGRGGAAYPSGTPPYGTPMASGDGTGAGSPDARPEERKTETTLTTRIRINIPGSRPIPPVVMRKTVGENESGGNEPGAHARPEPAAPPAPEPAAEPAPQAEEKTSEWFAPRKSGAPKGGSGGGGTNGAGVPGGSAAGTSAPRPGAPALGPGPAGAPAPNAPRPGGTNGSGMSGATGGPVAPGHGGGTGSFDVTEALASGPRGGTRPGEPARDDLPFFSDNGGAPAAGPGVPGAGGHGGPGGPSGFNGPGGQGAPGPKGPAGPTGGPVTGDGPLPTRPVPGNAPGAPGMRGMEPGEPFDGPPAFRAPGGAPKSAQGPQGGPQGAPQPGNPLGDDTAILTPQQLAAAPNAPGRTPHGAVSGHTVTSGIPVFPGDEADPFGPTPAADRPAYTAPKPPAPQAKAAPQPKKKGRSKLMLLVAGVVVVVGGAYGAGLLMNRTDVPKGTTVLGVDIGGGTRDDAVKKLDDAFRDRVNKPLQLSVGGGNVALTPDKAGLQFDYQATVSDAAKSDYNPLSVIGSLFGQKRVVQPVTPVDEEKLQVALQQAGGGSGSVVEGGIKFESGKAVAVYGKPGKAIDAAGSTKAVEQAYRTLVETGTATPVTVPTTTKRPTVPNAEVDREMKAFAEPAMSNLVTVRVDAAHSINFGPRSLPKILGFKAVGGKLTDTYNLEALKEAYGTTFEGVKVESATGKRDVLPQDVVAALRKALVGRTTAERVGVIDTKPN